MSSLWIRCLVDKSFQLDEPNSSIPKVIDILDVNILHKQTLVKVVDPIRKVRIGQDILEMALATSCDRDILAMDFYRKRHLAKKQRKKWLAGKISECPKHGISKSSDSIFCFCFC